MTTNSGVAGTKRLTEEEEKTLGQFFESSRDLLTTNPAMAKWFPSWDRRAALKFLRPRKFNAEVALSTLTKYLELKETIPDWSLASVQEYIMKGAVWTLPHVSDKEGRVVVWNSWAKIMDWAENWHVRVVAGVTYVEHLLDSEHVQAEGIINVIDFKDMPYMMDPHAREFFDAFQSRIPLRTRLTLCINTPLFFQVLFKMASFFLSKKMLDRVKLINESQLIEFIDENMIPTCLFPNVGKGSFTHMGTLAWLTREERNKARLAEVSPPTSALPQSADATATPTATATTAAELGGIALAAAVESSTPDLPAPVAEVLAVGEATTSSDQPAADVTERDPTGEGPPSLERVKDRRPRTSSNSALRDLVARNASRRNSSALQPDRTTIAAVAATEQTTAGDQKPPEFSDSAPSTTLQ